jgi:hypothetical protein
MMAVVEMVVKVVVVGVGVAGDNVAGGGGISSTAQRRPAPHNL